MGWETRASGRRYYTRSYRQQGKIVRQYIGTGELAEIVSQNDAIEREVRIAEATEFRQSKLQDQQINQSLDLLDDIVDCLSKGFLIAIGYHQHNRSEWRKRSESQ